MVEKILSDLTESFGDWFDGKFETPSMTNKLYPYEKMFSPIQINKLNIKNRLVMGPMGNISMCEETGRPNEKMLAYFEERAKGGIGLITTGLVPVSYGIDPTITELGGLSYFPRIDRSRTVFSAWRDLSSRVHCHGSAIFVQLTAGLGRVGNPQCLVNSLKLPVSASWNPNFYIKEIPCMRLCDRKIKKIIKNAGQASADSKAANIDGVYLHGHEGYLMEQLTNPAFNRRKIGRFASWQNFGLDMVKEIRKRVGKDYPIMYRIDLSLALNATYGDKMKTVKNLKKFRNERRIVETLDYMKNLVLAGVDMFDVDLGCYDNWWLPHPPASMPSGCFLEISALVKQFFAENNIKSNAGLDVPVVAVGKLGYPDLAEKALREDKCDMIMLARPLLADPNWAKKAYKGECEKITPCIGCQECIREFVEGGHPQCAVNPLAAFEDEMKKEIEISKSLKRVAVVGGGPGGIVCANTLIKRGHKVVLFEKSDSLGGMLEAAGKPKIKYEIGNYKQYLEKIAERLQDNKNFSLKLSTKMTTSQLKDEKFDVIVTATGATPVLLPIDGIKNKNVFDVTEVLNSPKLVENFNKIIIIGGGDSGCELAYFLKYELKKEVTIIEKEKYLMANTCTANRGHLLYYLDKAGCSVHNLTKVLAIRDNSVKISKNISKNVPNPFDTTSPILPENIHNPLEKKIENVWTEFSVACDCVVVACSVKSNNELYLDLVKNNAAKEIYNIGDSNRPGKIFSVVKSAYRTARNI